MIKRIAIQLFGHLRCWEETHNSIIENIIKANPDVIFDIFIHTWSEIDAKQAATHYKKNMAYAAKQISKNEIDRIKNTYNPIGWCIEDQLVLEEQEIKEIEKNKYEIDRCLILKNMAHTFCSVNHLRMEHEKKNGFNYDLILTTRPDVAFLRPLNLSDFYKKTGGWEFFETLDNSIFTTYINGISSVISQQNYLAGIDLLLFGSSNAMNFLSRWKAEIDDVYVYGWAEKSLTYFAQKYQLIHNYIYYEKDKHWQIKRLGSAVRRNPFNLFYKLALPLLIKSDIFCQDIYLNTTKYVNNRKYLKKYLGRKIKVGK